ncbi:caspase family protein [Kitasatospora sp. NPDC047058]|uniref:HD domain-containing protein n=1 Tax=Kitasatospora sp. NPDC047058 TaxID=3155620 RepID=UPI0033D687BA
MDDGRGDGPARTALLIGVGDAPAAAHCLPSLAEPVTADLGALEAALLAAGYEVETLRDPTRNAITDRITAVSRTAPPGSTLLLHYTGHGVRIGDSDYLVPADGRAPQDDPAGWDQPYITESLLDADISRYLAACRAGTVLWLIDACRAPEADGAWEFGTRIVHGPPGGGFVVATGCEPGGRSTCTENGSHFTGALAEAFGPLTEASTVDEVLQTAARLTGHRSRHRQSVRIHYGTDLEARTRATVVTSGRRLLESWREAVTEPALWAHVPPAGAGSVPAFQECLAALVETVGRQVDHAQRRMPDPWADDDFPVRLLRDRLPRLLPKETELSALEVTALIAGVLLHEAARADRLSQAREFRPRLTHHQPDGGDHRRHYEQLLDRFPQTADKLRHYAWWDGPSDGLEAAMLWLVHRWISERFEIDEHPVPAAPADSFAAALLGAGSPGTSGRAEELAAVLREVAAGPALGVPADGPRRPSTDRYAVRGETHRLRARPLAALLRVAALLALDARALPDVVLEHLAVSDPVHPGRVTALFRSDVLWQSEDGGPAGGTLHLDALCPHPAVHSALGTLVEDADETSCALRELARQWPGPEAELLAGLPQRITDRGLRPDENGGRRAYDVPLLRFSLAQTEVRRLLMGEDLYDGKPELALRELYQNAMDACRYRKMRETYLHGRGLSTGGWDGTIRFTTGEDARGRWVECRDNGVGMTVDQLKSTFTRAGSRFEQSREFRWEQAAWLRHDRSLRLYPNSRFGIGVFSYFMLADEMTVVTRPVGPDGRPGPKALRVEIPGSGSLFRIQEVDGTAGEALPGGGTAVRLYLKRPRLLRGDAVLNLLRSLVHVSEFRLEVTDGAGTVHGWEPGVLRSGGLIEAGTAVEAVPGTLWWVHGKGAVLCDGIAADKRPFGYVLNLTGPNAARLSVNRQKIEAYDLGWEAGQWRLGAAALAGWPALDLDWLHELEAANLRAARTVWGELRGQGIQVKDAHGTTSSLDEVGWFTTEGIRVADLPHHVRTWRARALGMEPGSYPGKRDAAPTSIEGYPVPEPGCAAAAVRVDEDWRSVVRVAHEQDRTVAEVLGAVRGLRIIHPSLAVPAVRAGDFHWIPDYLDRSILIGLSPRDPGFAVERGNDYRHAPQDLRGLVRASAGRSDPLGQLAEHCARYAPFLHKPLGEAPEHHRDHVCAESELALLYVHRDGRDWRPVAGAWDVAEVCDTLGIAAAEASQRLARFAWLGWHTPDPEMVDRWRALPSDLRGILKDYRVRADDGRQEVPWAATIGLAAEWEIPLTEADRVLADIAGHLGLSHRRKYSDGCPGYELMPESGTAELALALHRVGIRLENGVSLRDLAFGLPDRTSWDEAAFAVDELREAGVNLPDAGQLLTAWDDLPVPSRYAFSGRDPSFSGADYPVPPSPAVLFTGSSALQDGLSYLWDTARRDVRRLGLPAELAPPPLPTALKDFRPTRAQVAALVDLGEEDDELDGEWFESPTWAPLTATRLSVYAHDRHLGPRAAYGELAPLRGIGALVPELAPDVLAGLPDAVPTARDLLAAGKEYRVSEPGGPLVPLDLVSIAGRLGEPLARTWRRIAPYLPLEAAPPQIDADRVPDVLPLWQDLAVLSEGLDGRLPAAGRQVTPERLAFAADGVGESAGWVRARLAQYADLFGLELPPAAGPEDETDTEEEQQ